MLVIAGKKVVRRKLGWVGEFCPVCRGLECLQITRLTQVSHVYFIPLGRGKVVVHEQVCRGCRSMFGVAAVPYVDYARRPAADVVGLIAATNPDAVERHTERLDLEDRIGEGQLTTEERLGLIAEPLIALNYAAAKKVGKGMVPTGAGFCIVFLVFLVPGTIIAWLTVGTPIEARLILSGLVALLFLGTWLGFKHGGRGFVRNHLHPRLVSSLAPIRPTLQELETVLEHLTRQQCIIGKRVRAAELFEAIERSLVTVRV